ncbi:hypothetical protein [Rathayibacter sp. VKM Ac-2760]|uniref:hypothetical protein n=1 Tax=Rathayibacter sp. VKM Ac-2760 TaxID=2609253 RepID=UPI001316C1C2|nr:hypothetical protein [Rathayibacter sp. VKM Ac-2760]QHC60031.1 hypothetical protein GSU72_16835 [Rathayibacter sp. VKM Ac-2760]
MTGTTADRPTTASRAATLRLAGLFVGATGLLDVVFWFAPAGSGSSIAAYAVVLLGAGLLAAAASVLARGADSKGGLVGATGATAFIVFALLIVLRPLVRWFSPSTTGSTSTPEMIAASTLVLTLAALSLVAGVVGLVALARARTVPRRVVVLGAVALAVNALGGVATSIPLLLTATPSQELLIGVNTVSSMTGSLLLLATGVVWLLASRTIAREA